MDSGATYHIVAFRENESHLKESSIKNKIKIVG
jgi:hypothetical protein